MAKGQLRGNKESKKPKQPKKPEPAALPWGAAAAGMKAAEKKKK